MKNIKGLPKDLAFWIIDQRPFESIEDFILRLPSQYHKLPLLTPLVELGLFDCFEKNRRKVLQNLPNLFVFADELGSLFGEANYSWMDAEDYSKAEKYEMEQRVIGVGLSPHPLVEILSASSQPVRPIASLSEGEQATILVEVQSIRTIRTKNGENMAFLQVSDLQKKMDVLSIFCIFIISNLISGITNDITGCIGNGNVWHIFLSIIFQFIFIQYCFTKLVIDLKVDKCVSG